MRCALADRHRGAVTVGVVWVENCQVDDQKSLGMNSLKGETPVFSGKPEGDR